MNEKNFIGRSISFLFFIIINVNIHTPHKLLLWWSSSSFQSILIFEKIVILIIIYANQFFWSFLAVRPINSFSIDWLIWLIDWLIWLIDWFDQINEFMEKQKSKFGKFFWIQTNGTELGGELKLFFLFFWKNLDKARTSTE